VRATSSQRCVRAGGKHNDLENVGYTARHNVFRDARQFLIWRLFQARRHQVCLGVCHRRSMLRSTHTSHGEVYQTDDEAFEVWNKVIGLPVERIVRIGDNPTAALITSGRWAIPGLRSVHEIFYDHGAGVAGGPRDRRMRT